MTVTTTLDRQYYNGDGGNLNFPFNFRFFNNSEIFVFLIGADGVPVLKTLNVDYTLTGAQQQNGGTVTFSTAPPAGSQNVFIQRILPQTQPTSVRNQGAFFPAIHEDAFDRLTMLIQQALAGVANSLGLTFGKTGFDFKGYRGINAADPVNPQDVTTKSWVSAQVSGAVASMSALSYTLYNKSIAYTESLFAGLAGGIGYFLQGGLGARQRTFQDKMREDVTPEDFGAIGDGTNHTLSERFGTLADAQAFYFSVPVTSLNDAIDWAAIWAADVYAAEKGKRVTFAASRYRINRYIIKKANWVGQGPERAMGENFLSTIIETFSGGNPERWLDITGTDAADFTPAVVMARGSTYIRDMTVRNGDDVRWSCAILIPAMKRCRVENVDTPGQWKAAGVYVDGTASNTNTTMMALHPTVEFDSGTNELVVRDCYLEGLFGMRGLGTSRDISTLPWVWSPNGTSDITIYNCRFTPTGPTAERASAGGGFGWDVRRAGGPGQGIHLFGCSFRIAARWTVLLGWANRVNLVASYAETISSWNGDDAYMEISSTKTSNVCRVADEMKGTIWVDGVSKTSSSAPNWNLTGGIVTTYRNDGMFSGPNFNAPGVVGSAQTVTFRSFYQTAGWFDYVYNDGTVDLPYFRVARNGLLPQIATPAMDLGVAALPFRSIYVQNVRVALAMRPETANTVSCGTTTFPWSGGATQVAFSVTSDIRIKQDIEPLDEAALDAADETELVSYRLINRVEKKGDDARHHVGVIAQQLEESFANHGLDPFKLAVLGRTVAEAKDATYDEMGTLLEPAREAVDLYNVRLEEFLVLKCAALSRNIKRLEDRISAMESNQP